MSSEAYPMKRPGYRKVLWFMVGLALGTLLVLIPLTTKNISNNGMLPDRLAAAEFIISLFIAVALVRLSRRYRSDK